MSTRAIVRLLVSIAIGAGCGDNLHLDTPQATVTPAAGLRTTEAGGQATFTVALDGEPRQDVLIELASSNTGEGAISPPTLTFTRDNFDAPQTITITGVQDALADGAQPYTIVLAPAASMDWRFDGLEVEDVRVENIDDDTAGLTVTPLGGLSTTEAGGTAALTVVLSSRPTASVAIALASSDVGEGTVSPAELTFTVDDWNAPRTVTVTGVDDALADGMQSYRVVTAPATSSDPGYAGLDAGDVPITNTDDDSAGVTLSRSSGLGTTESGGADTFTVVLDSQPAANVTVALSSSDTSEGTITPTTLTFTPANWNSPQSVTVTGCDDPVTDGNQPYTIVLAPATSSDPGYDLLDPADVAVMNIDDDIAGFTVDPAGGLLASEFGDFDTLTIVLDTAPAADVTIGLSISDSTEATLGGVTSVTFTPLSWNVPQTITVTGLNDALADGTQPFLVVTAPAVSADPSYNGLDPPDIDGTNFDNDTPAVYIKARRLLRTAEGGNNTFFRVSLTTQPTSSVTCTFSSNDATEGTVSPTTLTFTPASYATQQTVNVQGIDDAIIDGDQLYTVISAPCTSADGDYDLVDPRDVSALNRDDD